DALVTAVASLQTTPLAVQAGPLPQGAAPAVLPLPPLPNGAPAAAIAVSGGPGSTATPFFTLGGNTFESDVQRLVDGGFSRERAEALRRRADELALEQMRARYEAERDGRP